MEGKGGLGERKQSVRMKRVSLRLGRHAARQHGRCRERGANCDRAGSLSGCGGSQAEKDLFAHREGECASQEAYAGRGTMRREELDDRERGELTRGGVDVASGWVTSRVVVSRSAGRR